MGSKSPIRLASWRAVTTAIGLVILGTPLAVRPARAAELVTAPSTLPWLLVVVLTCTAGAIAYSTSAADGGE